MALRTYAERPFVAAFAIAAGGLLVTTTAAMLRATMLRRA